MSDQVAGNMVIITTGGEVCSWDDLFDVWAHLGKVGGETLKSIASNPLGGVVAVAGGDTGGNVMMWDGAPWVDQGDLGGWKSKMVYVSPGGDFYGVGADGKAGFLQQLPYATWVDPFHHDQPAGYLGGWHLKMLAFDGGGVLWGVNEAGAYGSWQDGSGWQLQASDSLLKMLAFDKRGGMWCVDTDGKLGLWNGTQWEPLGLDTPPADWLFFA